MKTPVDAAPEDPITTRLRSSRLDLLDLSLRNPLLNYRPSMRRGLEVIDEKSSQLFSFLVADGGSLRIHHTKNSAPGAKGGEVFYLDDESPGKAEIGVGEANAPNSLATPYTKEALAARLLATASDAWLTVQEQGINTLFLALGMLQWKDEESPEFRFAPIVLVPVRLERKSARSFWQLTATDEDCGFNLSLAEKLKELGIRLPAAPALETVEDLEKTFALLEEAVAEKPGWAVARDRAAVGFFSFGKFLMYKDLDPEAWPEGGKPGDHPVLGALLRDGFRDRGGAVPPAVMIDAVRPPGKTMEVMDADGSQAEALAEAAAGRSLVIQGPPGTGKSQTISNLIAEAVSVGKRVLFVAEKLAALEVVKRRLEAAGLGELCLELHSNKASKKEVAAELGRTLALGRPKAPAGAEGRLAELREALNRYATAASTPVGSSEVTPYRAIGVLERLGVLPEPLPKFSCPSMAEWTRPEYESGLAAVQDLAAKVAELGVPARHPFNGCGLVELMPGDLEKIEAALREAVSAGKAAAESVVALEAAIGIPAPADSPFSLVALAGLALEAPDLRGLPPISEAWDRPEPLKALAEAAERAGRRRAAVSAASSRLIAQAWDADVLASRGDLLADGGSWWKRLMSGRYKEAKRRIQSLCTAPAPGRPDELIALTDRILEAQRLKAEIVERLGEVRPILGARASGADAAWDDLVRIKDWALRFRAFLVARRLMPTVAQWIVTGWDRAAIGALHDSSKKAEAAWRAAAAQVRAVMAIPVSGRHDLEGLPFATAGPMAEAWLRNIQKLPSYVSYWRLNQAVSRRQLGELASMGHEGKSIPGELPLVLEQAWAQTLIDRALRERPELREFDAVTHEQVIQRFRKADEATFPVNRARLAGQHWESLPGPVAYGQVGTLRREAAKKSRHLPIRRLMEQAGAAVQAAKPVFLMSPLSVAAYLPPGGPVFDLVVFDEASQVRPVDALGSVLRGRQLVVVGDEKQLPPTSFFDTMVTTEGVTEGEEDGPGTNVTQDMQSILGLCAAQGMLSRMLRWHYRSRHDSLIALSNREFYENGLVIFPSPSRSVDGDGLSLRYLPDTVYERGTSRTNPLEADAVAQAVLEHSRAHPSLTLGVVAFSQSQRVAIEHRIEVLARKHADFDAWIRGSREEPFFVKNLENVQGDERDAMLISVGYGKDSKGQISMNLGPLNQAGGERRLNVLITRARRRCIVFTNLSADDLDLRRAGGAGIRAFKAFLAYAKAGRLEAPAAEKQELDAEFEMQVHAALRRAGYQLETQVGSGGYRIDLAVVDPASPGRFLLGIECDGARYHTARWARDRDRLREAVLRGLGWTLHRIWSADWHRNREDALRRCVAAIEASKTARPSPPPVGSKSAPIERTSELPQSPAIAAYAPAKVGAEIGETHLSEIPIGTIAQFLAAIVDEEGPVHVEEVKRRVLDAIQARSGSRRDAAIEEGMAAATARALVRRRGDFFWPKTDAPVAPRDRSGLPDASRRHDFVCDEEVRAALERAAKESCGCDADEAAAQAIRILGVKKNEEALARLKALFASLPPGVKAP